MKDYFIGIDGCRGGWVAAILEDDLKLIFSQTLEELREEIISSSITLIDMPMGLKSQGVGERICDIEARKFLKKRKMSIFPVPCRQAVYSSSYIEANETNRRILGKGLSKQSYNLFSKIMEIDTLLSQDKTILKSIHEGHPEISFARIGGGEMLHNKKTVEGFQERLAVIEEFLPVAGAAVETFMKRYKRSIVAKDDILDAIALALAAKLSFSNGYLLIPEDSPVDSLGIPMRIFIPLSGR